MRTSTRVGRRIHTYPNSLTGPDVDKKPSPLQDEDKENSLLVEYMQNREKMQLRLVFGQTVTARAGRDRNDESGDCDDDGVSGAQKKEFMEHLVLVEFSTKAANRWIVKVRDVLGQGVPGDEDWD